MSIRPGMTATLSVPAFPGRRFPATVAGLSSAVDPQSGAFRVQLLADNPHDLLKPGGYAQLRAFKDNRVVWATSSEGDELRNATTETVDFDELNDAGIFLLTGPTGAGKTSILDAVCFALYGVVPGVREVKTLRSHHAAAGVAPEVVLEATIGERRYRIRRSPEWHRPKKRGDGTTRENACATLVVLEDDGTERLR